MSEQLKAKNDVKQHKRPPLTEPAPALNGRGDDLTKPSAPDREVPPAHRLERFTRGIRSTGRGNISESRILRPNELAHKLGVSRVTLWRWERQGLLPAKAQIGPNTVGWLESEIDAWWSQKIGGSSTTAAEVSV